MDINLNLTAAGQEDQLPVLYGVNGLGDHLRLIEADADLALYGHIPAGYALPSAFVILQDGAGRVATHRTLVEAVADFAARLASQTE